MENILVTGGAGFMGSHYISKVCNDSRVINLDKLTYAGNVKNIEGLPITNIFYVDISSESIPDILSTYKIDTIINFAAQSHVDRSITNPKDFIDTDVIGVFNLVYWSLKCNIKLMVHISTDEVYGDWYKYEADEKFPLRPNSPYASSKACADLLILSYIKTYNFPAIIIRPCNNYGIRQYPEKLIPLSIIRLLMDKKVLLHGDGKEIREWIAVEDCCSAIDQIAKKGRVGEIYNLGSRYRCTNLSVIERIINCFAFERHYSTYIERIKNRPGNDSHYAINSKKLLDTIGEYRSIRLDDKMNEIIKWYESNYDWWSGVNVDSNVYKDNVGYLR